MQSLALACLAFAGVAMANNAIYVNNNYQNQKHVFIAITQWGSDWYYSVMCCMAVTAGGCMVSAYMKPRSDRIFFYLCAAICSVATIAYFAMGSNLGWTPIDVEWQRPFAGLDQRNREIFYARYIDWWVDHESAASERASH